MSNLRLKTFALAGCVSLAAVETAAAGGFDRGGVNIDLLFDPSKVTGEAGITYVSPQRTIENVQRLDSPPFPVALFSASVEDQDADYIVPRVGIKVNVFDPVDCLATYTKPFGADQEYGLNNAYSPTATEFGIETDDFGLTCSYKMQLGRGMARIIGGVSYGEVDAFLSRQTLLAIGNPGVGTFQLSDDAWSWRIGAAYEIPEIAFRASLVYSAAYDYDNLTGTVDTTGFAVGPTGPSMGAFLGVRPVSASSEVPQAVEFKLQSGIAPGWLAFASVRWQEWSKLQSIPIAGVISPTTGLPSAVSFDPFYQDGWTVSGGIGHVFTEHFSGAASITWDRGTSTISGTQTDTWTFGAGGSWTPNENVELRFGGVIGVLTGGSSTFGGGDTANAVTYTFGDDLIYALSGSLKVKWGAEPPPPPLVTK